jgi:uncharacterized protein YbjT (DUF2867 family)
VPAGFLTHQKAPLRLIPIVRSNALTSRSSAEARIAKTVKNRVHLDLRPHLGDDQTAEAARLRALGATDVDVGQGDVPWTVLAGPGGQRVPRPHPALTRRLPVRGPYNGSSPRYSADAV